VADLLIALYLAGMMQTAALFRLFNETSREDERFPPAGITLFTLVWPLVDVVIVLAWVIRAACAGLRWLRRKDSHG